jgi:hypothetical protein
MAFDYSKKALLKFLDTVVEKGLMNANTAGGLKAACGRILDDLAESDDVREIDVGTAVIRYSNRNPGFLAPNSLAEYQRRVARAISEFVQFAENPAGFKPRGRGAGAKNARRPEKRGETKTVVPGDQETSTSAGSNSLRVSAAAGLALSFPLRTDFLAQVVIPRDLRADEARRLGAFLMTLAMDYQPAADEAR